MRVVESKSGSDREGPLYLRIAKALREEIVSGVFPLGSHLPTEDELGTRFAVSRYTVREALRRLREDGLVSSRQGAGTTVVPPRASDSYAHDVMSISDVVASVSDTRFVYEAIAMATLDARSAARTGLAAGSSWLEMRGLRVREGGATPLCWTEFYINSAFAGVGRLLHRHHGPVFPLIEDLYGQTVVEVHQEIGATLIGAALAERLGVGTGTAGLELRREYRTADGTIAQVTINTYPAARFRHAMTLRRVKG